MKQFLLKIWQDEEGAETAEWLVIVAMLTVIGTAVYAAAGGGGTLQTGLNTLATNIVGIFPL